MNGRLITIMGEEDTLVSQLSNAPYVEADSEALENSFRALEIANERIPNANPMPSNTSIMMAKLMIPAWQRTGEIRQGMENSLVLPTNRGRAGLGYKPNTGKEDGIEEKKKRMTQLGTSRYKGRRTLIPHISEALLEQASSIQIWLPWWRNTSQGRYKTCIPVHPRHKIKQLDRGDVASSVYFTM
ncbi:hypothetical protein Lal_00037995 [Lupinus albus]|nr:hypothetical protein Lal_00037995 [Lupinus albus]